MAQQTPQLQVFLVVVVSIGWATVVLVPVFTDVEVSPHVLVGVQTAMAMIIGAIFGINAIRISKGPKNGDS